MKADINTTTIANILKMYVATTKKNGNKTVCKSARSATDTTLNAYSLHLLMKSSRKTTTTIWKIFFAEARHNLFLYYNFCCCCCW